MVRFSPVAFIGLDQGESQSVMVVEDNASH